MTLPARRDVWPGVAETGYMEHQAISSAGTRARRDTGAREATITRKLEALAATLHRAGQIVGNIAEDLEDQLAESGDPSVMDHSMHFPGTSPQLLGVPALAHLLDVDPRTIRRWRKQGKLPAAVDLGGVLRWRREDVDTWLQERVER